MEEPRDLNEKKTEEVVKTQDGEIEHGGPVLKDGMALHPQPTSDPLDPLNWSSWRKNSILAIVMALYFLFTMLTSVTIPSFLAIQELYGISTDQTNWTIAIPALGLAVGPLFWSSFADIYGRRIIFIIGTTMAFAATLGSAYAPNYGGYMAARFFQGFGASPAATVGLAIINDIFFDYQRGQKIGLWVLALDTGLLVGPLLGGFVNLASMRWIQLFTAILFAAVLVAEIFFLPETLYPRNQMLTRMPYSEGTGVADIEKTTRRASNANEVDLPRTKKLGFINVKPVPGMRHPKPWDSLVRFFLTFKYLTVFFVVFIYCFGWYWWILSVATLIPYAYPSYAPQIQGLLFIGLLLGTVLSEILLSGRLSDLIVKKLALKQGGVCIAEMRLWLAYPAALFSAIGLIVWGISIDKQWHWITGQIALFLFAAGVQMGNTVVASYIVDCYPLQSMSIITFYSVLLNLSAFIDPFFIIPWQTASGYTWCFAAQGIITFFFCVPAIALVHYFGPQLRKASGTPPWVNPEYDSST